MKKETCSILGCSLSPSSNGKCWKHQKEEKVTPVKDGFKSQVELFNYVWDTRPHVSEISGRKLTAERGSVLWLCYFMHILPKGKFPKMKLNPDNILLGHNEEHFCIDQSTEEQREKYKKQYPKTDWNIFYDKQKKLKEKYEKNNN
jgi:hypothetical protein